MSITEKAPRGIRNNNPGNIRRSSIDWRGEVATGDQTFEVFDTPEQGIRALGKILRNYQRKYGLNTVRGIINRWAPPTENNTDAYVQHVAEAVGADPDEPINVDATLSLLVSSIILHENGINPYPAETIQRGVELARA